MYYISRIFGAITLAALGVAVWFSIVLARADFYYRADQVLRATEIAPRNTEYLALRALHIDYEGGDARGLLEKIAALNPYSSAPRIRLGLAAEVSGDSVSAERWLLDAARVDRQFEPRWTLASFYFRAGNKEEFWRWIRAALDVSYGDRTPVYELCWRVSDDAGEILRRGIPDRHEVVAGYLIYLLSRKSPGMAGVQEVAGRLAAYHDAADLLLLLGACDRLIQAGDPAAIEVWVLTGQAAPAGIFNGDFAAMPLNHGFDWRTIESPGVTHINLNAPAGHRVVLSGQQAESVSLLQQMLSLRRDKRYRLQWESRTVGIKSPSGLEWRLAGPLSRFDDYCYPLPHGRGSVPTGCPGSDMRLPASEDWRAGELTITGGDLFIDLELVYQRPVGESRAEGNVELRHIRLVAL
jgi:hypothetical protein